MSLRWLLLMPAFVALATSVMLLGPYAGLREKAVPFDESPARSSADAIARLKALGPEGVALYRAHLRWDTLFIAANFGIFVTPTLVFGRRLGMRRSVAAALLVPAIAFAGCDLIENALITRALGSAELWGDAHAAARFSNGRFTCFVIAGFVMIVTALGWTADALRQRLRGAATAT